MRILAPAMVGILVIGLSVPASAAKNKGTAATTERSLRTYEACETKAHALGLPHGQTGHSEYVRECMGFRPRGRNPGS
jgi:hypothetical protein